MVSENTSEINILMGVLTGHVSVALKSGFVLFFLL